MAQGERREEPRERNASEEPSLGAPSTVKANAGWVKDGLVQTTAMAANVVGGLLVAWLATRILSEGDFGIFAWGAATVTFLGFFGRFGGMQASTISLAQVGPEGRAEHERAFLGVTVLGSIVAAVLWVLAILVLGAFTNATDDLGQVPLMVGLWLPITAIVPTIGGILRGRGEFVRAATVAEYVRKLSVVLALIVFAVGDLETVERLFWWIIAFDALVVVFALVILRRGGLPSMESLRRCFDLSKSFAVMSIGAASVPAAAVLAVGFLIATTELALLGVGLRVLGLASAGYAVLVRVATPRIAKAYSDGTLLSLGPTIRRFAFVATAAQAVAFCLFALVGREALGFAFGDFYRDAFLTTLLLLAGALVNTYFGPAMLTLVCSGDRWFVAKARVGAAVVFTVAAAVLSVQFGAVGLAICFLVTMLVFNAAMWRRVKVRVGLDTAARWDRDRSLVEVR